MKRVTISRLTVDSCGTVSLTTVGIDLLIDDNGCLSAEIE